LSLLDSSDFHFSATPSSEYKIIMIRTKLILAFITCLLVVLIMATLLFWGPERMAQQLDRGFLAHQQAEAYLRLSNETYRHFWHLADRLIARDLLDVERAPVGRSDIRAQIEKLERLTLDELQFVGESEPEEKQELLRIKQLADAIAASVIAFNGLEETSVPVGERSERLALLQQKIDRDFADLIDAAIDDERGEAEQADEGMRRLAGQLRSSAAVLAVLASVMVAGIGYWLLTSIRGPVEMLLLGTQRIAAGDLGHRIPLSGRDELAHLASSFNGMAEDLENQRIALLQAQSGLEQKVQARTSELAEANLTLTRLDEIRKRMFADISHELRTPLTIISGEAEVTLRSRTVGADEYRTTLKRIVDLTGQVATLVEDLMLLARSDSADLRISRQRIAVGNVLEEAGEDLRVLGRSRNIDVAIDAPEDAGREILADPRRLAQLLLILVDNACRYTGPDGRIVVSSACDEAVAWITVADSGIGIPAEEIDVVFDRYFRGRQARQMAPKGSGLGLHVAKTIAEAHGGSLTIRSKPDCGTTVTLSIPLYQADEDIHADPSR
jgi:signal transduction histidine kinase